MDPDTWDRNKDRPQFVRQHREQILDATTDAVAEAMPEEDASTFAYRQFLNSYKGTVTRQINDDQPGSDPHDDAETPTDDGAEGGT